MTNRIHLIAIPETEEYPWLSAAAHCKLSDDAILYQKPDWKKHCEQPHIDQRGWPEEDDPLKLDILRRNVEKGLPCGAEKFIRELEKIAGRPLHYRPLVRPKNDK